MLEFEVEIHNAIWGRERWLLSARKDAPSRVAGGSGETLIDVCPGFPLLIKEIDAERRLSVQVHPNDETAKTVGGEAKTEMWFVTKAGPIFAGFKPGVSQDDVRRAVGDGSFEDLLVRFDSRPGECYFIPGGLVHAIGEGTGVFEVQQSSDTTFRLYDWGRVGSDGKPRKLHVTEALAAMDITLPAPTVSDRVDCRYFTCCRAGEEGAESSRRWRIVYEPSQHRAWLVSPGEVVKADPDTVVVVVK